MLNQTPGSHPATNLHQGMVKRNHGGHEVNDIHEILGGTVTCLNTYTMLRPHIQDQELLSILDRQYQFIADEYNMLVQCFSTGEDPQHGTNRYQMNQSNENIQYGLQQKEPTKPMQSSNELNDEIIACHMQAMIKGLAGQKAMAALEIVNPVCRRVVADSLPNCIEMSYEIFLYQNKHGYYQVPQYTEQDTMMLQNAYAPVDAMPQTPMQH